MNMVSLKKLGLKVYPAIYELDRYYDKGVKW